MSDTHILFIDPLEKLSIKKDSSLLLALSLKKAGKKVFLLFEEDFFFDNTAEKLELNVYDFEGSFNESSFYVESFSLAKKQKFVLGEKTTIHMRIDPPFDTRYLRYLWMLISFENKYGVKTINKALGILKNNEKLLAYERKGSLESYVGSSKKGFLEFIGKLKKSHEYLIMKPLDLYQGIGVEKVKLDDDCEDSFVRKVKEFDGPVVCQPFVKEVESVGEIRTVFFKGREIGTILKKPPGGSFLANIAQGADFKEEKLSKETLKACEKIAGDLLKEGVDLIAYDILGDSISEINITCPGLLVEVSSACKKNLAMIIANEV